MVDSDTPCSCLFVSGWEWARTGEYLQPGESWRNSGKYEGSTAIDLIDGRTQ